MMGLIQKITRKVSLRLDAYKRSQSLAKIKRTILSYYKANPSQNNEINEALIYLKEHKLNTFLDSFHEKYRFSEVKVELDSFNGLNYVSTQWGKLYFKRSQNVHTVKRLYNGLIMEQDPESPHCYTDTKFYISEGDVLADIGSAEAIFSLMNIHLLKKVYLFEQDKEWIEALEATFAPWKDKVVIIPKYVSDVNTEKEVSLDSYFKNTEEKPTFYKIDVEGAEQRVLDGLTELRKSKDIKIALCTYHKDGDYEKYSYFFEQNGYSYYANKGLMFFINDISNIKPPFFRKGLIKASR